MKKITMFLMLAAAAMLNACEYSMSDIMDELTIAPGSSVIYDGNGADSGEPPVDPYSYVEDSVVTVLDNTRGLVKTDTVHSSYFGFTGWNTASDGSGTTYTTGQTFQMGKTDVTLYAMWATGTFYRVTYSAPDATSGTLPTDNTDYASGSEVFALNNGDLARAGWNFQYWTDGFGHNYSAGDKFTITADTTLSAVWTNVPVYTVTYNGINATSGLAPVDSKNYKGNEEVVVRDEGSLKRTGYGFGGWNTMADGSGTTYQSGQSFFMPAVNIDLYSVWTGIEYFVHFNANGGTGDMDNQGIIFDTTEPLTLLADGVVPFTHGEKPLFTGWATTAAGNAEYGNGANYTMLSAANVNLYATWDYHGAPDKFFDSDGFANAGAGKSTEEKGYAMAVQTDGKIVVAGTLYATTSSTFIVARFNTDGSLDTTFNARGDVPGIISIVISTSRTYNEATSIAIQSDGKIIVAGTANSSSSESKVALVRIDSSGTIDKSFGEDKTGIVTTSISGTFYNKCNYVTIDSTGRIIVAGSVKPDLKFPANFAIWRFTSTGAIDTSFSSDGAVTADINSQSADEAYSAVVQSTGIIIVAGKTSGGSNGTSNFALAAFSNNGIIYKDFGSETNGKVITDFGQKEDFGCSMVLLDNDNILVSGYSTTGSNVYYTFARYNAAGTSPATFGDQTSIANYNSKYNYRNSMAIQLGIKGYKIVIAGTTNDRQDAPVITFARYNTDGSLDNTFDGPSGSGNGIVKLTSKTGYYANSVAIFSGKIYAAGYCGSVPDIAVMRLWQ